MSKSTWIKITKKITLSTNKISSPLYLNIVSLAGLVINEYWSHMMELKSQRLALEHASYISKIASSEIVIINVIEGNSKLDKTLPITIKANPSEGSTKVQNQIDKAEGQSEEVVLDESLQKIIKEIATVCKDVDITKEITYKIGSRDPADEIINVSKLMRFDLIIMGSQKISSRIGSIGSTTRKVASTVEIPILIVQRQSKYKDEY